MSRSRSAGSRKSVNSREDNRSSDRTYVNHEKDSDGEPQDVDDSSMLSPTRTNTRLAMFADRDKENLRSAERDASHMGERQADQADPEEKMLDSSELDGDSFDHRADHPVHVPISQKLKPVKKPLTKLGKFFKWIHNFSMLTRWILYITPLTLILLIPILVGALGRARSGGRLSVGGVYLQWFAIWWMIIWLSLWAAKLAAKLIPLLVGPVFSIFTNSYKKWRDLCTALEIALTLFFWWLAIFISFLPIVENHQTPTYAGTRQSWQTTLDRIVLTVFIATCINLVEKLIIQLIAIGFHERQYDDRIVLNKFQIASLTKLYTYSRETSRLKDDKVTTSNIPSGIRTPNQALAMVGRTVQNTARDAVGKVTGEIAGRRMEHSNAPRQIVLSLLDSTSGAQTLARRLFASYHCIRNNDEEDYIRRAEMRDAFSDDEEADAAFAMFDKDFNGDVTCEEMEIACVEISKERKSITSSLKDLDHAVSKLDDILTVVVAIIVVLIFISLISRSFTGVLTSAGTTILGLSWLFSQLAQEFLASIVFVFVKHPFDVGDRVDVMMNSTVQSLIVKEISLMATEFRLLDGRIVQAPNNVLNQLFILNMRRTGGVAEGVNTTLRFGVSIEKIDALRQSMVEFVRSEPRDYKPDILSELTDIPNLTSVKFTLVFFHKQNWQNEGLRIGRRNKFMCALMVNIQQLGMESAVYNGPGGAVDTPMFLQYLQPPTHGMTQTEGPSVTGRVSVPKPFDPLTSNAVQNAQIPSVIDDANNEEAVDTDPANDISFSRQDRRPSVLPGSGLRRRNARATSVSAHMAKVDYSLGATDFAQSNTNDFFEESQERGLQAVLEVAEEHEERAQQQRFEREKYERKSASRARSPSTMSNLHRVNTNMSTRSRTGRLNRFRQMASRSKIRADDRPSAEYDEEYSLDVLNRAPTGATLDSQLGRAQSIDSIVNGSATSTSAPAITRESRDFNREHRDMSIIPEGTESPSLDRGLDTTTRTKTQDIAEGLSKTGTRGTVQLEDPPGAPIVPTNTPAAGLTPPRNE